MVKKKRPVTLKAIGELIDIKFKNFRISDEDFNKFKELMNQTIEERTEDLLVTKEDIKFLPTTEVFLDSQAKLTKEIQDAREENEILHGLHEKINRHEEDIERIKRKLKLQTA